MKKEDFAEMMNQIDDAYLAETDGYRRNLTDNDEKKKGWKLLTNKKFISGLSMVACLAIVAICGNAIHSAGGYHSYKNESASTAAGAYDSGSRTQNGFAEGTMEEAAYDMDYAMSDVVEAPAEYETVFSEAEPVPEQVAYEQKLIRTYYYNFQTLDFDGSMKFINDSLKQFDGYMESSEIYGSKNKSANLVLRIPTNRVEEFLETSGSIGEITYQSVTSEDVTLNYYDIAARVESLQTQHDRLIELMDQAENLSDIAQLEAQLSDVEYQINSMQSTLKVYDNLVDYTTIRINLDSITPVTEVEEDGFLTKVKKAFFRNGEDAVELLQVFVIGVIAFLPYLLFLIPAAIILYLIWGFAKWIVKSVVKGTKSLKTRSTKK